MDTQMKSGKKGSRDVESGLIDSGLAEETVVRQSPNTAPKKPAEEIDDPKSDINCYGVGVIKMDS